MTPATLKRLTAIAGRGDQVEAERLAAINDARSEGHTLSEIGRALGITRQRVHQLLAKGQK